MDFSSKVQGRSCGGCTLCCKSVAAETIGKATGTWCKHTTSTGCGIFAQRWDDPTFVECRSFQCLWLQGYFDDKDRPDKSKAIYYAVREPANPKRPLIVVNESHPGALNGNARAEQIIRSFLSEGLNVLLRNAEYVTEYHATGEVFRRPIDTNDPLRVRFNMAVAPMRISVRGRLL